MTRLKLMLVGLITAILLVAPGLRAEQTCNVVDTSEQEVLPGVFLKWDSSFLCANAPDSDTYKITVNVRNDSASAEAVEITTITLVNKTPKPKGKTPPGEKTGDTLPITVAPGASVEFMVTGHYTLVKTDEGKKANHHYLAAGIGVDSGEIFALGINVHFRAPGVAAE